MAKAEDNADEQERGTLYDPLCVLAPLGYLSKSWIVHRNRWLRGVCTARLSNLNLRFVRGSVLTLHPGGSDHESSSAIAHNRAHDREVQSVQWSVASFGDRLHYQHTLGTFYWVNACLAKTHHILDTSAYSLNTIPFYPQFGNNLALAISKLNGTELNWSRFLNFDRTA